MAFYSDRYIEMLQDEHTMQRARVTELKWAVRRNIPMPGFSWEQTVERLVNAAMRQENLARHIALAKQANKELLAA